MTEVMNDIEVARLKAVLPNDMYYYQGSGHERPQGLYCTYEHDLLMPIHGGWDVQTVLAVLLKRERSLGEGEGRRKVYREMAQAIGMDAELKDLREQIAELKDKVNQAVHAATR